MLNLAILSAGNIAARMAQTLANMPGEARPYAVAARDAARAAAFAARWGFEKSFGSYETMLADPAVDLVYIASIHPLHAPHVRAALLAGKHVLCEKPLTLNAAEADGLFALARERGLFLAEAMWTCHQPFVPLLRSLLAGGAVGQPVMLTASLGDRMDHIPRIARRELGGGALLDIGIYPLTLAALAFGPGAQATGMCEKNGDGVDLNESIALHWPDGRCASLAVSARCPLESRAVVYGTHGRVELEGPCWRPTCLTVTAAGAAPVRHPQPADGTGFEPELRAAVRAVETGRTECSAVPAAQTLYILGLMDALRARWGVRYPGE